MSKIDIRLRRQQFTKGRIQRHKNYGSLLEKQKNSHRRRIRGVVLLAFIFVILTVLIISLFNKSNAKPSENRIPGVEIVQSEGPRTLNN